MRILIGLATALFVGASSALTTTYLHDVIPASGATSGRLIVQVYDDASAHIIRNITGYPNVTITHRWDEENTFAGIFGPEALSFIRASPYVKSIGESAVAQLTLPDLTGPAGPTSKWLGDVVIENTTGSESGITQTDATWGLSRLSCLKMANLNYKGENFAYTYPSSAGAGVDIYVVDSGVQTTHIEFKQDRARWGATFGEYPSVDDVGHGTYCAAIAAGRKFGVAKNANIIAVKAGNSKGIEAVNVVSGLYWIKSEVARTGKPSVVSISTVFKTAEDAVDKAVNSLTEAGIHVIVSAGNYGQDVSAWTPSRVPSAITIGASTIFDTRAATSNFGRSVDLFAPGEYILSAWRGDDAATQWSSGTSSATPFVAGLVALIISNEGNSPPATMSNKVKAYSLKGKLGNIFPNSNTENLLAHIQ